MKFSAFLATFIRWTGKKVSLDDTGEKVTLG